MDTNQASAVTARFDAGAGPVSSVAWAAEDSRPDPAAALGDGRPAGQDPWGQSHVHGSRPRLLQFEEAGRGRRRPTPVERTHVPRAAFTRHGRPAVSART